MKLELTVDGKLLENLFRPNGESSKLIAASRLTNHTLIASKELLELWEREMQAIGLSEVYESWIFQLISSQEQFKRVVLSETDRAELFEKRTEDILIKTAKATETKVLVGEFENSIITNNSDIQFVNIKTLSSPKKQQVTLDFIKEHYNRAIPLKRYIFDLFELPVSINVAKDSSSDHLAKYLSEFYDAKTLIIQDLYLPNNNNQNEENLSKYILPFISRQSCNITFIISTENGAKKKVLEEKYGVTVKCIPPQKDRLHEGFIKTSKYRITIPYRLMVFGTQGKNNSDFITITYN